MQELKLLNVMCGACAGGVCVGRWGVAEGGGGCLTWDPPYLRGRHHMIPQPLQNSHIAAATAIASAVALMCLTCVLLLQSHQYNLYLNVVAGVIVPQGETMAGG